MMKKNTIRLLLSIALVTGLNVSCTKKDKQELLYNSEKLGVYMIVNNTVYYYDSAWATGSNGDYAVVWEKEMPDDTYHGNISFPSPGTGARDWSDDVQFNWEPEAVTPRIIYQSYYDDGKEISTGVVTVTKWEAVDGIVEGTFNITRSGITKVATATTDAEYVGEKAVTGRFKVRRKD